MVRQGKVLIHSHLADDVKVWLGEAWQGLARHGAARQGEAWLGKAWRGNSRKGSLPVLSKQEIIKWK